MSNFLAHLICEHITFNCHRLFLSLQKIYIIKKLLLLNQTIKTKTSAPSNQNISVTVKHNLQNNSVAGLPNKKRKHIHGQIYEVEQEN